MLKCRIERWFIVFKKISEVIEAQLSHYTFRVAIQYLIILSIEFLPIGRGVVNSPVLVFFKTRRRLNSLHAIRDRLKFGFIFAIHDALFVEINRAIGCHKDVLFMRQLTGISQQLDESHMPPLLVGGPLSFAPSARSSTPHFFSDKRRIKRRFRSPQQALKCSVAL